MFSIDQDFGKVPFAELIRARTAAEVDLVAAAVALQAANRLGSQAGKVLGTAAKAAVIRSAEVGGSREFGDDGDGPPCGNDLTWLLEWLRHHTPPVPDPDPQPWYEVVTIGLVGLVASQLEGAAGPALVQGALEGLRVASAGLG